MIWTTIIIILLSAPTFALLFWKHRQLDIENKQFRKMVSTYARTPGYSLQQKVNELFEQLLLWVVISILFPVIILLSSTGSSKFYSILICATIVTTSIYFLNKKIDQVLRLKKGLRGELFVGMELEQNLDEQFTIFHDFQLGDTFTHGSNIDHLIIGPNSIYIVETKYMRAEVGNKLSLKFDGTHIIHPSGFKTDQHLSQVSSIITQFKSYLKREQGISHLPVDIRGFLTYPGWEVNITEAMKNRSSYQDEGILVNKPEGVYRAIKTLANRKPSEWQTSKERSSLISRLKRANAIKLTKV